MFSLKHEWHETKHSSEIWQAESVFDILRPVFKPITQFAHVYAVQWRIVPVQNWFAVVFNVWNRSAGANPFLRVGHGGVIRKLDTTADGGGVFEVLRATEVVFEILKLAFETGLQVVKHFAQSCYFPCCQCTEKCSNILPVHGEMF